MNVLLVDDAPYMGEIVRHSLAKTEFLVVGEARDGESAIKLALAMKPDIILMDVVLPIVNGIEAARRILATHPSIAIIAFSTVDQDLIVQQAIEAGCRSFLTKPFRTEDLIKALRSVRGEARAS